MNLDRFLDRLEEAIPQPVRIGRYEILREIDEGGSAVVFLGHDAELDRNVAIKAFRRGDIERLRIEASAAAQLRHPNIVTVFEVGPDYIVMEYVEGRTLAQALPELSLQERLRVLLTVARAADHAHSQNVIHRDIKPGNVLVEPGGRVLLSDFGLAKIAGGSGVTVGGSLLGTPEYMAPEQVSGEAVDRAADVWSLGVMLYEMVANRRPFEGKTSFETYELVKRAQPEALTGPLGAVAHQALDKNPKKRYPTAAAFADEIERFLRQEPVVARTSLARRFRIGGLVLGAVVLVGLGAVALPPLFRSSKRLPDLRPRESELASGRKAVEDLVQKFTFLERTETEALVQDPINATRLLNRANLRVMRGLAGVDWGRDPLPDWLSAEDDLTRALAITPAARDALFRRGELRARIASQKWTVGLDPGSHCGAVDDLGRVMDMPGAPLWSSTAHFFCGLWRTQHGQDAHDDFSKAEAELTPADAADKLWRRARARAFLGKFAEAETDFSEAVKLDPQEALAWYWRGVARKLAGDLENAEQYQSRSIASARTHWRGWEERGDVRLAAGRNAEALEDYAEVIALDGTREPVLRDRIRMARSRLRR